MNAMHSSISRRSLVAGSVALAGSAAVAGLAGNQDTPVASASEANVLSGYTAGTYSATAVGRRGDIEVEVTFLDSSIQSVTVTRHSETPCIAGSAIANIPQAIVDGQTLTVDMIAGATLTSNAILTAVADCVGQAGGDADALQNAEPAPSTTEVTAGTYQATAHGHHSDVTVEVTLDASAIKGVSIVESGETFNLSNAALNTLPQAMVDAQSYNVDVVSAATFTSRAIASAVEDCIVQAGGIEAARGFGTRAHVEKPHKDDQVTVDCDVAVIGSGMAGIVAAVSAQESGARVALFEKNSFYGGVSQTVRGYFAIAQDDSPQAIDDFVNYGLNAWCGVMKGTMEFDGYPNRDMLATLAANSWSSCKWLEDKGVSLIYSTNPYIYNLQPEYYRMDAHFDDSELSEPNVVGSNLAKLVEGFLSNGGELYLDAALSELTVSNGAVVGCRCEGASGIYTVNAKSVIVCTGGFGASEAMTQRYAPAFAGESKWNATLSSNTGEGIYLAEQIGAAVYDDGYYFGQNGHVIDDDHAQIHPYQDHLTPMSTMWVNREGLRVNCEDAIKYAPSQSYINPDGDDYYWVVVNDEVAHTPTVIKILGENLSSDSCYADVLDEQIAAGNERFIKADTIAELANQMKIMPNILRYTLNRYNEFCAAGADEDFNKSADYLVPMEEGPWYAVKIFMKYFGTTGGVVTNTKAAVLDANGVPIKGLYAAGEASNHGFWNVFYPGARSTTVCLVMGKIAGESAAAGVSE